MALIDNLVSYWMLEEPGGTRDDSHGSNDLTEVGGPGRDTGKLGNAATFNGSANYLKIADNADLSTGDVDFTIGGWIYLNSTSGTHDLISKYGSGSSEYILLNAGGEFRFYVQDSSGSDGLVQASSFGTASTGTWYLVHAWHDSVNNQIGICVNAGTADTTSWTTGVRDGSNDFILGSRTSGSSHHDGRLDSCFLWKKVLSGAERTEQYNSGAGLEYPFSTSQGLGRRRRSQYPPLDLAHELTW